MNFWQSIILGIIQGATEFLPISSSGHLYLLETYFGLTQNISFEIYLHFASLLAVVIFFWKTIVDMAKNMIISIHKKHKPESAIFGWKLILATFLTAPVGIFLEDYFDDFLSVQTVAGTLIFTGILVFISDRFSRKKHRDFCWPFAITLGIVQGFAVIPGISRSGLTIAFLIMIGIERKEAAKISFLLSIPTIAGAALFAVKDAGWTIPVNGIELIGCVASFIIALLAIRFMMHWIKKYWIWFAPYCVLLGLGLLVVSW